MLDQRTDVERAGHWSECALCNPQSFLCAHEPLFTRTASKGKAVEANHHRLFPRVSMLHGSGTSWGART